MTVSVDEEPDGGIMSTRSSDGGKIVCAAPGGYSAAAIHVGTTSPAAASRASTRKSIFCHRARWLAGYLQR